jgi:N-hydroxyarylamine O-acetyltransferase
MNGLLGAALAAAGFKVIRLCGGVRRADMGDIAVGNHLTLRVDLEDGPWLAEVGLGDALTDPIPMALGDAAQRGYGFSLKAADGDWWRFNNHAFGAAPTFDFRPEGSDEAALAGAHHFLMTDDHSPFRSNLILGRHFPDRIETLRNIMRRTVTPAGITETPVGNVGEFRDLVGDVFELTLKDPGGVWNKIQSVGVGTFA